MNRDDLPSELARRWSFLVYVKQRGHDEWSAECPKCGDAGHGGRDWPDRFRMWLNPARGWCRVCGYQDFADSNQKEFKVTDELKQQWIADRVQREEKARHEAEHALDLLRKEQMYLHYEHDMDAFGRAWWAAKGIPDYMILALHLGWCASRTVWYHGQEYVTPTATIPVFAPGEQLINIRHRLINPPEPNDKYRPDRAGLPAALYLTNPAQKPKGECILVEGEIKSMVVCDQINDYTVSVVGAPGKNPRADMLSLLDECDPVYVVFDPDATRQAVGIARDLGRERARVVRLSVKADDFFTIYGGTAIDFRQAIRHSRKV